MKPFAIPRMEDEMGTYMDADGDMDIVDGIEAHGGSEKQVDADFFNDFADDFDDEDVKNEPVAKKS